MSCVFIKVKAHSDIWQVCKENSKSDLFSSNWQVKAVFDASIVRRFSTNIIWRVMNSLIKTHTHKKAESDDLKAPLDQSISTLASQWLRMFPAATQNRSVFLAAVVDVSARLTRLRFKIVVWLSDQKQPSSSQHADFAWRIGGPCIQTTVCLCRGNFRMQITWQWWRLTRGSEHSGEQEIQETFMFSC